MRDRLTRRLSGIGVAFALALGGGAAAIAAAGGDLPEEAADEAQEAVAAARLQRDEVLSDLDSDDDVIEIQDEVDEVQTENEGDNAEAFADWVESLEDDWGCVRGLLVSHVARGGPLESDFEEFDTGAVGSFEDAVEELGLEGRRCVEVARNGEEADIEVEDAGPPDHAGPPENAGPPEDTGPPENAGPP